jgi:hypothetical protein
MVYELTANQCPVPIVPGSLLSIAAGTPTVRSVVTALDSGPGSLSTPFNRNATALDVLGRAGAGAYAVDWDSNPASASLPGFNLTVSSGLTLAIAAGQAVLDSVVQQLSPGTLALTDNISRIYLWLGQNGVITPVHASLTPPGSGAEVFIGSCTTSGGSISNIDGSGIMYFRGGTLYRRTADVTTPSDSPPKGLLFINRGPYDSWLFDGDQYLLIAGNQSGLFPTVIDAGDLWTVPAGRQAVIAELQVDGTLDVSGVLKLIGT